MDNRASIAIHPLAVSKALAWFTARVFELKVQVSAKGKERATALRGSAWVVAGVAGSKLVRGASTLILARTFLGPGEFGQFAIVSAFLTGIVMLSDLGIGTAVIRHPDGDTPRILDTAYWIQAARGILLYGVAVGLSFPFARFYHQSALSVLLIVGALEVVIRGFTSSSVWSLSRRVRQDTLSLLTVIGDLTGFATALIFAALFHSVWALVMGRIGAALSYVVATHFVGRQRDHHVWNKEAAKEILSFSAGMLFSSATFFLVVEGQRLALAKFITLTELGCFSLAMSISTLPDQLIGSIVDRVFYPMISKSVAVNVEKATAQFKNVRFMMLMASSTMAVGFIFLGPLLTRFVLGSKYAMAQWMVPLLGVRAALMLYSSVASFMLFALGFSKYSAIGNLFKLASLATGLTVAFGWFGFREAVWVLSLAPIAAHLPLLFALRRHMPGAFRTEVVCGAMLLIAIAISGAASLTSGVLWGLTRP